MAKKRANDVETEAEVEDDSFESTKQYEANRAAFEAANKQNQQLANEMAENQEIANFKGLPQDGETREQLLARIRKMRDEVPKPVEYETFRSEGMQKEFDAEQKAGQEAVAKAKAEMERHQAAWAKEAEGGKK